MSVKIYNGRGWNCRGEHLYIGAKNRSHAARLMYDAYYAFHPELNKRPIDDLSFGRNCREIKDYFHEGAWGNSMEGIEPEIGVWYQEKWNDKPRRLI